MDKIPLIFDASNLENCRCKRPLAGISTRLCATEMAFRSSNSSDNRVFVDPIRGNDINPGDIRSPLRTQYAALARSRAPLRGRTIMLWFYARANTSFAPRSNWIAETAECPSSTIQAKPAAGGNSSWTGRHCCAQRCCEVTGSTQAAGRPVQPTSRACAPSTSTSSSSTAAAAAPSAPDIPTRVSHASARVPCVPRALVCWVRGRVSPPIHSRARTRTSSAAHGHTHAHALVSAFVSERGRDRWRWKER